MVELGDPLVGVGVDRSLATTTSGVAASRGRLSSANSTPCHGAGEVRLDEHGDVGLGAVGTGRRAATAASMRVEVVDDVDRLDGAGVGRAAAVAADRRRAHDERQGAVVGGDAPDLGGGRPVLVGTSRS